MSSSSSSSSKAAENPAKRQRTASFEEEEEEEEFQTTSNAKAPQDTPPFKLWYLEQENNIDSEPASTEECLYADWTITVTTPDGDMWRTYQVHKPVLAAKSMYFKALFESAFSSEFVENTQKESTFEFPALVVDNFEAVLKYAYSNKISEHAHEVSVLLYLSDYFRMEHLQKLCKHFLQTWKVREDGANELQRSYWSHLGDTSVDVAEYYRCYNELGISFLKEFLIDWMTTPADPNKANELSRHKHQYQFLPSLEPDVFVDVMRHPKRQRLKIEETEDMLVHYCERRTMSVGEFLQVTPSELWPPFSRFRTCMYLLWYAQRPLRECDEDEYKAIADLESRCIKSLKMYFQTETLAKFDESFVEKFVEPSHVQSILLSLYKDLDTQPPENVCHLDSKALVSCLRDALKSWKIKHSELVKRLTVSNSGCDDVDGTYIRDGDAFEKKKRGQRCYSCSICKQEGQWCLVYKTRATSQVAYSNKGTGDHKGCPPFQGWKCDFFSYGQAITIDF